MRPIKNYENYLACENGDIISLPKKTRKKQITLKQISNKDGYCIVDLVNTNGRKQFLVHRIIAESFIENPKNKEQVNHKNGIKSDNRVGNLEWNTRSENQKHAIDIGLRSCKGEKNSQNKLKEMDVLNIFLDKRKYSLIANDYNISIPTISDIKRGYSWTHITKIENIKKGGKTQYIKI